MTAWGAQRQRRDDAFTLIEMMAVLFLLALIAGIALPSFGRGSGADAENDARELAAGIESARRSALTRRIPYRLVVDLRGSDWWFEHATTEGRDDATEPGRLPEWAGIDRLPLTLPPGAADEFVAASGIVGAGNRLRETVRFVGAQTDDGWVEDGTVHVELRQDGSADLATLVLEAENGTRFSLSIEPLDETVGVRREEG